MFRAYNVKIDDYFYNSVLNKHLRRGCEIYNQHEIEAKSCLKQFIFDNGHIDGSAMKNNWFQIENVDVFISHSHSDISKVKAYAGWLYNVFGLRAFIDSCAWGYCDDLLRQIDDKYCKKADGKTYNYNLRNYTTSHVHMMLAIALMEMIDRTECIMFYNTPSSVYLAEDLNSIKAMKTVTLSPWIYSELAMISYVRKNKPERYYSLCESDMSHQFFSKRDDLKIEYDVGTEIDRLLSLDREALILWKKSYFDRNETDNVHPLDVLYGNV